MDKIISIHQPNFFPWLGYFDKIVKSDAFILLDDVQFPKTNGNWINRVSLFVSGESRWITAPIKRAYHGTLNINEMIFDDRPPWRQKIIKTIEANYRKSNHYKEGFEFINTLINNPSDNIAEYNISNILAICEYLGINTSKLIRSSDLNVTSSSTQRIIDLVKKLDGNIYYCGGGASCYQEDALYGDNGVELRYQDYSHPVYEQKNSCEFVKGLSIIDAIFNIGQIGTTELLTMNTKNAE